MMRVLILFSFLSVAFLLSASEDKRPNVVFLLLDDQSYKAMGAMGNKEVHTPNMDQLAKEGVIFDKHYNTTSICMASRAIIMTGKYEYKTGCNFMHGAMKTETWQDAYPVLMRKAGYFTGFAGKFGFPVSESGKGSDGNVKNLPSQDFDVWGGGPGQTHFETEKNPSIAKYAKDYPHSTRAYGAWAGDFFTAAKKSGKPFSMSISFKAPHLPHQPDPFFDHIYKDKIFAKARNFGQENGKHLAEQAKLGRQYISFSKGKKFGYFTEEGFQKRKRLYYQLITGVDYSLGMIRQSLEKQGLAEDTVIILTSDNGYFEGSHGFSGKCLPYEEGSRAPLIVYDPKNKAQAGTRRSCLTAGFDLMPTILEMAGIEIPAKVDGKSLVRVLNDTQKSHHKTLALMQLYGSAPTHVMAVVGENWKYIYWPFEDKKLGLKAEEELFHLSADGLEMKNLASFAENKVQLESLRQAHDKHLQAWQAEGIDYNDYQQYVKIFDRLSTWQEKKKFYIKASLKSLKKELKIRDGKGKEKN